MQENLGLGPNGALLYCLDFLSKNVDWLVNKVNETESQYFIIDTPGQVETYCVDNKLREIMETLKTRTKLEIACVHLTDSQHCTDPGQFISSMLVALSATINLEMPFVNILSKIDLLGQYGDLPFPLEFYTEELDLEALQASVADPGKSEFGKRYSKLTKELCNLVDGYGLVGFTPLDITDKQSMSNVLQIVDKANGFAYKQFAIGNEAFDATAQQLADREITAALDEKYAAKKDEAQEENKESL